MCLRTRRAVYSFLFFFLVSSATSSISREEEKIEKKVKKYRILHVARILSKPHHSKHPYILHTSYGGEKNYPHEFPHFLLFFFSVFYFFYFSFLYFGVTKNIISFSETFTFLFAKNVCHLQTRILLKLSLRSTQAGF